MSRLSPLNRFGRVVFFCVMGISATAIAFAGIAELFDASEPTHWGTFTEEHCEFKARGGCRSVGTWVSDDGTIRLRDVYLDGAPGPDGVVRAEYGPTGLINDVDNNLVHSEAGAFTKYWVPWVCVLAIALATLLQAYKWRRPIVGPSRPNSPGIPGEFGVRATTTGGGDGGN